MINWLNCQQYFFHKALLILFYQYTKDIFFIDMKQEVSFRGSTGMKNKPNLKQLLEKLNRSLDFTPELLLGRMKIELICGHQATVEGVKSILDYDDTMIHLTDGKNLLCIMGQKLCMLYMTEHNIIIQGMVERVEYVNGGVKH